MLGKITQLFFALALIFGLVLIPMPSKAQGVEVTVEPAHSIFAETPTSRSLASASIESVNGSEYLCFWGKMASEGVAGASGNFVQTVPSDTAYDGELVFSRIGTADADGTTSVLRLLVSGSDMSDADLIFFRAQVRGNNVSSVDNVVFSETKNGQDLFPREVAFKGPIGNTWRQFEKVSTPVGNNDTVSFQIELTYGGHTPGYEQHSYEFDQFGVGYCKNVEDTQPDVSAPGEIGQLIGPVMLFGSNSVLVNTGTNATIFLDTKGFRSFEKLWEDGEAFRVLNRKFALGCSPFGITEGCYLGDKAWVSRDTVETWYHAMRSSTTRIFSERYVADDLELASKKLAKLIARNAPDDEIQFAGDVVKWFQGKLQYAQEIRASGMDWLMNKPVNLTFEMRAYELSRTYDGGRYSYVLSEGIDWPRLRAISLPQGISVEDARKMWDLAIRNGAPRFTKLIIGDVEEQITFWERWAPNLKNWNLPSIVSFGGTVGTMFIQSVRAGASIVSENALPIAGQAVAVVGSADVIAGTLKYYQLDEGETSMNFGEFLWSESLFAQALSNVGMTEPEHESNIGWSDSSVNFCISETRKFYIGYDLLAKSFLHPSICNYLPWKITDKNSDGVKLQRSDTGTEIVVGNGRSATYSLVSYDFDRGMVIIDFVVRLVRYVDNTSTAVVSVSFAGFRTSDEIGFCPSWLPPAKAQELGRLECPSGAKTLFLPMVVGR